MVAETWVPRRPEPPRCSQFLPCWLRGIHPASRGVAAHTASFFLSVTEAKGAAEIQGHDRPPLGSSQWVFFFLSFPPRGGLPS